MRICIRALKTLRVKPPFTRGGKDFLLLHANQLYCFSLSDKLEFRIKGIEDKVDTQLINIPSTLLRSFNENMNESDIQLFITTLFHQKNKAYFVLKEDYHYEVLPPTVREILNEKNCS